MVKIYQDKLGKCVREREKERERKEEMEVTKVYYFYSIGFMVTLVTY